jgi:predicted transcriptional regulator
MTTTNLPLSGELAKQLEDAARDQHREAAELLEDAVKQYLEDRSWVKLMGYGQERAKALGIGTEEDIDRLIAESRSEQRAR